MKSIRILCWSAILTLTIGSVRADEAGIQRFGLYVVTTDIDRSREFYVRLFQKEPYVTNERFIGFDVTGGLYAVFTAHSLDRKLTRGDNVVPYLRVKDIEAEYERVRQLPARMIDAAIVRDGSISLFRFADPDGNVIEFFSLTTQ